MSEKDSVLLPKSQNKSEVIRFLCILSQGILFCNVPAALKEKKVNVFQELPFISAPFILLPSVSQDYQGARRRCLGLWN